MKKKKKKKDVCSISFCLNREEEKHSRITRSLYQEKRGGIVKHIHSLCVFLALFSKLLCLLSDRRCKWVKTGSCNIREREKKTLFFHHLDIF